MIIGMVSLIHLTEVLFPRAQEIRILRKIRRKIPIFFGDWRISPKKCTAKSAPVREQGSLWFLAEHRKDQNTPPE